MRVRTVAITAVFFLLVLIALATPGYLRSQSEHPKTQLTMRAMYTALAQCYIASLNPAQFENERNREEILLALRTLSANAKQLEQHGELSDSFDFLQGSLTRDAKDAAKRYEERSYLASKYLLGNLTENCVSCHSKLPSDREFDLGAQFVEDVNVAKMAPRDRARIEIATRQFDSAMASYEKLIGSAITPDQLIMSGVFEEYFTLCLRVRLDAKRPARTVADFLQENEGGAPIEKRMNAWLVSLQGADLQVTTGKELDKARRSIQAGRDATVYPQDRSGLVHFIVASSVLQRFFETRPENSDDIAEAYYLLGVAESYTSTSYWVSETEFYLTAAVKASPKSTSAHAAYDFLYDYVTSKYTGSSGAEVPLDVQDDLDAVKDKLE